MTAVILPVLITLALLIAFRFLVTLRPGSRRTMTATEAAYVRTSRRLAVLTALITLRAAGRVESRFGGFSLAATGTAPEDGDPLIRALWEAGGDRNSAVVAAALRALRRDLVRAGWLVPRTTQVVHVAIGAVLLAFLGRAWWVAIDTSENTLAAGALLVFVIFTTVAGVALTAVMPRATRAGDRAAEALLAESTHITEPAPTFERLGPGGAGLAVALLGTAPFFAMDYDFARQANVPQPDLGAGGNSGGGCGGGCGGGGCGCGG